MMNFAISRAVPAAALFAALAACSNGIPTDAGRAVGWGAPPEPFFPPAAGPAQVYRGGMVSVAGLGEATESYVLYDNGAFELQYSGVSSSNAGSYVRVGQRITFDFVDWNVPYDRYGPDATGTLDGDRLIVKYGSFMGAGLGYGDAVFVRVPFAP